MRYTIRIISSVINSPGSSLGSVKSVGSPSSPQVKEEGVSNFPSSSSSSFSNYSSSPSFPPCPCPPSPCSPSFNSPYPFSALQSHHLPEPSAHSSNNSYHHRLQFLGGMIRQYMDLFSHFILPHSSLPSLLPSFPHSGGCVQ